MDLKLKREVVSLDEMIHSGNIEIPIECDFYLPDYYDDIHRVLKCSAFPRVQSHSVSGSSITVNGNLTVVLLYVSDQDGKVKRAVYKSAFVKTATLNLTEEMTLRLTTKVDYVNHRVLSTRRVDVRGNFSVTVQATSSVKSQILTECEDSAVQLRRRRVSAPCILGEQSRKQTVRDEFEVEMASGRACGLLSCSASVGPLERKVVPGKVILKGNLNVRALALSDTGMCERLEYAIPISQIIDITGLDESSICYVNASVLEDDIDLEQEGDKTFLCVDAVVCFTVRAHRENPLTLVTDAYSTRCDLSVKSASTPFSYLSAILNEECVHRCKILVDEDSLAEVDDIQCTIQSVNFQNVQGGIAVTARAEIGVLGKNHEGEPVFIEKTEEIVYNCECADSADHYNFAPDVSVESCSFVIEAGGLDLRIALNIRGCLYGVHSADVIREISEVENTEKRNLERSALTLYYAEQGEDLWDIAKRYSTSMDAVKRENAIEDGEIQERKMLLIPRAE